MFSKSALVLTTAAAIALTSFDLRPAQAAPDSGPAIAKQNGADELSAQRKRRRGGVHPAVPLAAFGMIAGTIAGIAAAERRREYYERPYVYGTPYGYAPQVYARMLGEKLTRHDVRVFLLNTGWTGGPYGVGQRIKLSATRAMVSAALRGALDQAETYTDPVFGLHVPLHISGVPDAILHPRKTWRNPNAYDAKARDLAGLFADNFKKFDDLDDLARAAGPDYTS